MALAITDKNGVAVSIATSGVGADVACVQVMADQAGNKFTLAPGLLALPVQSEGVKTGYSYAILGFAPVATPTDILEIKGSATKTVRVRRIEITGVATAAGNMPVQLIRRSTVSTGGGSVTTAIAAFKPDTAYAAATAVVSSIGTANPTLGAQEGGIAAASRVQLTAAGTGLGVSPVVWDFAVNACVLRGVGQFLYLNFNGAAIPAGGLFDINLWISEDAS